MTLIWHLLLSVLDSLSGMTGLLSSESSLADGHLLPVFTVSPATAYSSSRNQLYWVSVHGGLLTISISTSSKAPFLYNVP